MLMLMFVLISVSPSAHGLLCSAAGAAAAHDITKCTHESTYHMRLRLAMMALAVGAVGRLHVGGECVLDLGGHLLHACVGVLWGVVRSLKMAVSGCLREEKLAVSETRSAVANVGRGPSCFVTSLERARCHVPCAAAVMQDLLLTGRCVMEEGGGAGK